MQQGFINVNKPQNVTSAFVVNQLKKHFNLKHVGHMGTLDPLASGVLPIAIGKATRMFGYFNEKKKEYIATFKFGIETDTLDILGEIVKRSEFIPSKEQIEKVLFRMIGEQLQMPPNYSAKKINGKKAYELARSGKTIELQPCKITIYEIELLEQLSTDTFKFRINCSGGTYIRSVGRDLSKLLNTTATMTALVRTVNGKFNLDSAYDLNDLLKLKNINSCLMPIEKVFNQFETLNLSKNQFEHLTHGVWIEYPLFSGYKLGFYKNVLIGVLEINQQNKLQIKTYLLDDEKEIL